MRRQAPSLAREPSARSTTKAGRGLDRLGNMGGEGRGLCFSVILCLCRPILEHVLSLGIEPQDFGTRVSARERADVNEDFLHGSCSALIRAAIDAPRSRTGRARRLSASAPRAHRGLAIGVSDNAVEAKRRHGSEHRQGEPWDVDSRALGMIVAVADAAGGLLRTMAHTLEPLGFLEPLGSSGARSVPKTGDTLPTG